MKKSKLFVLATLCLAPLVALSGCENPKYFTISASSSNAAIGSVSGGNNDYIEGASVKLIATSRNESTNPFICWIKNYSSVYSQDSTITLSSSEENKGNYTALFQEDNISSMTYAMVSNISFDGEYSNLEYTIQYSTTDNTGMSQQLAKGAVQNSEQKITSNVLKLTEGVTPIDYIFSATIIITDITGTTNHTIYLTSMLLNDDSFNATATATLQQANVTITLSKLTKSLISE